MKVNRCQESDWPTTPISNLSLAKSDERDGERDNAEAKRNSVEPLNMAPSSDFDLVTGSQMQAVERHVVGECRLGVFLAPDEIGAATNFYLVQIRIAGRSA